MRTMRRERAYRLIDDALDAVLERWAVCVCRLRGHRETVVPFRHLPANEPPGYDRLYLWCARCDASRLLGIVNIKTINRRIRHRAP